MEPDSAGNEKFSFGDLDIDYELVTELIHGDTIEAFANEIAGSIKKEIRELGVLGANNPPLMEENRAASANADLLDPMVEKIQNLAQPAGSSSPPPSTTTQQIYPPIMQQENQSPAAGNNDLLNSSSSIIGNEDIISTNKSDPSLANPTTLPQPSFGTPVMGTPKPYCPIRPETLQNSTNQFRLPPSNPEEQLEPGILGGNESFLAHGNFNQENMLSPYSAFDTLVGSSTNAGHAMGSSFSSISPTLPEAYPPTAVGLVQPNGVVQSAFPSLPDGNWMSINAHNAQSQNSFQIDFVPPQWMAPVCADQLGQNIVNNNVIPNTIQQAPIYAAQYPQTIIGTGVVDGRTASWMNQPQPTWLSLNSSSPYRPLPPSGPQRNQFMASHRFHPENGNSMLQGPSMPLRTQYLFNGMPVHNQITRMSNIYAPHYNDSVPLGHSRQPWPQQFANQNYQNHMVSNVYNPQRFNTRLPGSSSLALRTPHLSHGTHGVLNFQHPSSSLLGPISVLPSTSMTQPLHRSRQPIRRMPSLLDLQTYRPTRHNSSGQLDQVPRMNLGGPIRIGPQHSSSIRPVSSSVLPGTQVPSAQGRINQASVIPGLAESHPENPMPPRQQAQGSQGALNATTGNGKNPMFDTSQEILSNANRIQQNTDGPCWRRSRPETEDTASSCSSRRSKRKRVSTTQEEMLVFDFAANEGTSNAANAPRPIRENTGVYDPAFERAGLYVDPHLRMFVLNWL